MDSVLLATPASVAATEKRTTTLVDTLELIDGCAITATKRNVAIDISPDGTMHIQPLFGRRRTPSDRRRQAERSRKHKLERAGASVDASATKQQRQPQQEKQQQQHEKKVVETEAATQQKATEAAVIAVAVTAEKEALMDDDAQQAPTSTPRPVEMGTGKRRAVAAEAETLGANGAMATMGEAVTMPTHESKARKPPASKATTANKATIYMYRSKGITRNANKGETTSYASATYQALTRGERMLVATRYERAERPSVRHMR